MGHGGTSRAETEHAAQPISRVALPLSLEALGGLLPPVSLSLSPSPSQSRPHSHRLCRALNNCRSLARFLQVSQSLSHLFFRIFVTTSLSPALCSHLPLSTVSREKMERSSSEGGLLRLSNQSAVARDDSVYGATVFVADDDGICGSFFLTPSPPMVGTVPL